MAVQIQLRHDTAANWAMVNPLLAVGEVGVETDTSKVKLGNGVTPWNGLPYGLGATNPSASAVATTALQPGQPVSINPTTGQAGLAGATSYATSFVTGLAASATSAGFVVNLITDSLTLQDWSAVTGTPSLYRGQPYFLGSAPGTLSLIAPTARGQSCVVVGLAVSSIQMLICPTQPILL